VTRSRTVIGAKHHARRRERLRCPVSRTRRPGSHAWGQGPAVRFSTILTYLNAADAGGTGDGQVCIFIRRTDLSVPVASDAAFFRRVAAQLRLGVDGAGLTGMAVSQVVALRGPGGPGSVTACRPAGLASERRACLPGPRRGVAQKRRERHQDPWNWACPPRSLPAGREGACFHGGSDDRGRSA